MIAILLVMINGSLICIDFISIYYYIMDTTKLDNIMNNLDNCGDTYCGNIITSTAIKEEESKFLKNVTKKCRSKKIPKNENEYKIQNQKYDKCFTKYKKRSNYYKRLTQRKKCEDKHCSIYQKKIQKILSFKK